MGGLSGPPGPARRGAETERSEGSSSKAAVRGILLPALIAVINGTAFVAVYMAAFHAPVPHHLPIAVVAPGGQAQQLADTVERSAPGRFDVRSYPDADAGMRAVEHRDVFGVLVVGSGPARLLVGGGNSQAATMTVTQAFSPVAQAIGGPPQVQDLRPLVPGDSRGLALFYAAFGVVLGGFLFGIASFQSAPQMLLRYRIVSILLFAVVGGAIIGWLADVVYAALPAGWLLVSGLVALLAAACGATAAMLFRLVGSAGQIVTSIGLVIIGNAASGGSVPEEFLPAWMEPLARILPTGVAVRALRGATYFDDDGVAQAFLVLALWCVVPLALIAALDALGRRREGRREREEELSEEPAREAQTA